MKKKCPSCGAEAKVLLRDHVWAYGPAGPKQLRLMATVPIIECKACDDEFLDYEAEDIVEEVSAAAGRWGNV